MANAEPIEMPATALSFFMVQPPSSSRRDFYFRTASRQKAFYERRICMSSSKLRIVQNSAVQRNSGVNALDDEHFQRARHARNRLTAIFASHHQLRNQ